MTWYLVLLAIPVGAYHLFRDVRIQVFFTALLTLTILWGRMLWLEAHADDSDPDIIFAFAVVIWGMIAVTINIAVLLVLHFCNCLLRLCPKFRSKFRK